MAGVRAREEEQAGSRNALELDASGSTPLFSFSFSLKIANKWLAAGALAGGLTLAAFLLKHPELVGSAVKRALEAPGLQVGSISTSSIRVGLQCDRVESFLLFVEDFENEKIKRRLEKEFKEELEVTLENYNEVYEKVDQIR